MSFITILVGVMCSRRMHHNAIPAPSLSLVFGFSSRERLQVAKFLATAPTRFRNLTSSIFHGIVCVVLYRYHSTYRSTGMILVDAGEGF